MTENNRIEYKRELTSELDIEKEVIGVCYSLNEECSTGFLSASIGSISIA